jgi:hypothetical protein
MAADAGFAGVGRSGWPQHCYRSKSSWLGSRRAGLRSALPPWSSGSDARPSTWKRGFDSRRGYIASQLPARGSSSREEAFGDESRVVAAAASRRRGVRTLELAARAGRRARRAFHLVVGEMATPPASGAGDRWFDSSRPDQCIGVECDRR